MVAAWPGDVNTTASLESYSETFGERVDSFQVELGQPLARRRSAFSNAAIKFSLLLTSAEVASLRTFWRTTLKSGVLPFTMTHPRTGVSGYFEFNQNDEPPSFTATGGGLFLASLSLIETT